MFGKFLKRLVLDALDEHTPDALFYGERQIFDYLDIAANHFARATGILHASTELTTVEDQQAYDLPPDFIRLYLKNNLGRYFIKYNDGSVYSWPILAPYERLYKTNLTDSRETPARFALRDKPEKESLIEGEVSEDGAVDDKGESALIDEDMLFSTTNRVHARDVVHNTTRGASGFVLSVTGETECRCALFNDNGDARTGFSDGDAYIIQPAAEKQIYLDAPSATAGHTMTVEYVSVPNLVYTDYGFWRFPSRTCQAICWGAAQLLRMPGADINGMKLAGAVGGMFQDEIRRVKQEEALHILRHRRRGKFGR